MFCIIYENIILIPIGRQRFCSIFLSIVVPSCMVDSQRISHNENIENSYELVWAGPGFIMLGLDFGR